MWYSITVTINPGTTQRLAAVPTECQRLRITPLLSASGGVVYVLAQDPAQAAVQAKTANNFITELAAATATVPGGMFTLDRIANGPPINVQEFGLDGAHADTVQVSWEI